MPTQSRRSSGSSDPCGREDNERIDPPDDGKRLSQTAERNELPDDGKRLSQTAERNELPDDGKKRSADYGKS